MKFFDLADVVSNDKEKAILDKIIHKIEYTFVEGGCVRIPGVGLVYIVTRKKTNKDEKYFKGIFKLDIALKTKLKNLGSEIFSKLSSKRKFS